MPKGFAKNPMVRCVPLSRITPSTEKEFGDALKREDDSIEIKIGRASCRERV
jgi:hypothetical protein